MLNIFLTSNAFLYDNFYIISTILPIAICLASVSISLYPDISPPTRFLKEAVISRPIFFHLTVLPLTNPLTSLISFPFLFNMEKLLNFEEFSLY